MLNTGMNEYIDDIAPFIHQAALNPHCNSGEIQQIVDSTRHLGLAGLCTSPINLPTAREILGPKGKTKLIAVIAFPFGYLPSFLKIQEAEWAIEQGAEELDIVPNFFALNEGKGELFAEEIAQIGQLGIPINSILDIGNLSTTKLDLAVEASIDAGTNGIQTGNGFGSPVCSDQIKRLDALVKNRCAIKAVGGIKTLQKAEELLDAGANYIGTSFGLQIVQSMKEKSK